LKVVITGGTGFIGQKLAAALAERGDSAVVLTRGGARPHAPSPRITFEAWDPEDPRDAPWTRAITEADAVVHLAGAGVLDERWTAERIALIRSSRTIPTRRIADLLAAAPRKPRVWLSASAVGIYGMRKDDAVLDEQAPHGDDVLATICQEWEAATAPAKAAGVRVAIPRIGIVLGTEGGALAKMLPPFKAFVGGPVGDGTQWVSWVHWHDVVRAFLFALDTDSFAGAFNLSAPKPVTMNALAHAIGGSLHRPSAMRVPAFAARAIIGPGAEAVLTGQRVVPTRLERAGFTFAYEDVEIALRDLLEACCQRNSA
jgi:uncharacterized protein (TIGR01777 family)